MSGFFALLDDAALAKTTLATLDKLPIIRRIALGSLRNTLLRPATCGGGPAARGLSHNPVPAWPAGTGVALVLGALVGAALACLEALTARVRRLVR